MWITDYSLEIHNGIIQFQFWMQEIEASPSMRKEAMVNRSCFGVEWYSKNWVILKIQPNGLDPSKQDTSSFIRWGLGDGETICWFTVDEVGECWLVSNCAIFRSKLSSLVAMEFWVAMRWNCVEVSLAMTSLMRFILDLECMISAMCSMKAPKLLRKERGNYP